MGSDVGTSVGALLGLLDGGEVGLPSAYVGVNVGGVVGLFVGKAVG